MPRVRSLDEGPDLLIATHNAGKQEAVDAYLDGVPVRYLYASDLGLNEPVEDGGTFEANADIKAIAGTLATGLPCLADDSGVEVDALHGAPGVETAAYMTRPDGVKDYAYGREKLRRECLHAGEDLPRARALCTLSFVVPADGGVSDPVRFVGTLNGTLRWPGVGDHGFGFEPVFVPDGSARTLGQIPKEERVPARLDHRAKAFDDFIAAFRAGTLRGLDGASTGR